MTSSYSRRRLLRQAAGIAVCGGVGSRFAVGAAMDADASLIGHWPLIDDARDDSGNAHHGQRHGAGDVMSRFDGRTDFAEIPADSGLDLARSDFSISAWLQADDPAMDVVGDVIGKWDPVSRKGFTLCVKGSSGGYNSHGSERNVHFGIDDADPGDWEDCGRPNLTSNYISNSLTVFDGSLYAATSDAQTESEWCHVYRYARRQDWVDCGRVGNLRTRGVGPLVVHNSQLYAATWSYDWVRVNKQDLDSCHVYRYAGGTDWEDCGQPGECRRLFGIASYGGRLFVVGDDNRCWVHEGGRTWAPSRMFRNLVHPMAVHDGRLYAGEFGGREDGTFRQAEVFAYDGQQWASAGHPMQPGDREDQIHALHVHQGKLHATTWPKGKVAALQANGEWTECGRLGRSTECNALNVYNGKLYAGTIPRAEVYRYEGGTEWTRIGRFCPPEVINAADQTESDHWGRVTSLTAWSGRLYAGIGSYTSSIEDAAADARGRVYAIRAGHCVSYDRDIGGDWRHVTAVRRVDRLEIYLDGALCAETMAPSSGYDLSNRAPLMIGFGPTDYFSGEIQDVRLWRTALDPQSVRRLAAVRPAR